MDVITAEGDRATMTTFAISNDNYITVLDALEDAQSNPETQHFSSLKQLGKLAAEWPSARLLEIWNNLPGTTRVKKFTDRKTAVTRIWKQILGQSVAASPTGKAVQRVSDGAKGAEDAHERNVVEPAADVTTANGEASDEATRTKRPRRGAPKTQGPREGSKTATVLALLKRAGGVSSQQLMDATGWQAHSVRGFLSGTVVKKMGLALVSAKGKDGTRKYSIQR
jgi:hypothetical protein